CSTHAQKPDACLFEEVGVPCQRDAERTSAFHDKIDILMIARIDDVGIFLALAFLLHCLQCLQNLRMGDVILCCRHGFLPSKRHGIRYKCSFYRCSTAARGPSVTDFPSRHEFTLWCIVRKSRLLFERSTTDSTCCTCRPAVNEGAVHLFV